MKLKGLNLVVDIAQSEPADVAQVVLDLRAGLVALIEEIARIDHKIDRAHSAAWHRADRLVRDLDAGELLWPGWARDEEKAARG